MIVRNVQAATEETVADTVPGPGVLLVLAVLLGFASISTDLFLPALPTMQAALGASEGAMGFVISAYLLGFGAGQLFWGPVSDRIGRRLPIALGVLVFTLGSAGCALSGDAYQIIAWRVVQALGASAGVVLARAMVRDLYDRDRAARVLSILMTVMTIAPLLGPTMGAQILAFASWQTIFWTLSGIGITTFLGVLTLPESLPAQRREGGSALATVAGYLDILRSRRLLGYALAIGFFYIGIFANIAGAPFAYIDYYGLSPQAYGLVFAMAMIGLMVANTVNSRVVERLGTDVMLLAGAIGATLSGAAILFAAATDVAGAAGLIVTQFLFFSMNGLILANGVAGALASVGKRTGAASAVVGVIQYGGGMVGSALVGILANATPVPMAALMTVGGLGCLVCARWTRAARA